MTPEDWPHGCAICGKTEVGGGERGTKWRLYTVGGREPKPGARYAPLCDGCVGPIGDSGLERDWTAIETRVLAANRRTGGPSASSRNAIALPGLRDRARRRMMAAEGTWYRINDRWGRFHRSRPVFAVIVRDGRIVDTAPIGRKRLMGREWSEVRPWLRRIGVIVQPVMSPG